MGGNLVLFRGEGQNELVELLNQKKEWASEIFINAGRIDQTIKVKIDESSFNIRLSEVDYIQLQKLVGLKLLTKDEDMQSEEASMRGDSVWPEQHTEWRENMSSEEDEDDVESNLNFTVHNGQCVRKGGKEVVHIQSDKDDPSPFW
ncbi:unnamed protein product [Lupinus luteus]|uniref:Uncharacterized protein n=1 Tax=Lupinus luteus TaxID=3873 RepID=A0AAV1Y8B2_LUPLU